MKKEIRINSDIIDEVKKAQAVCEKKGAHEHCEDIMTEHGEVVVCHDCKTTLGKKCEVYSRVVGYLRPVSQWNLGKKEEFKDRKEYTMGVR
jgi:anaerobic ribonucleoside-triphosphate reductase